MQESTDLLTVEEASAYLRVCTETIRRWIRTGEIPASKIGGLWRLNREALKRLVPMPVEESRYRRTQRTDTE